MKYYQLKNYRLVGDREFEGFREVKLVSDDTVFYAQPICLVEYGKTYTPPYYIVPQNNDLPIVVDYKELVVRLSALRMYYLKVSEDGSVVEVSKEESDMEIRLPIDIKVENLEFKNGSIYMVDRIKEAD